MGNPVSVYNEETPMLCGTACVWFSLQVSERPSKASLVGAMYFPLSCFPESM